MSDVPQMGPFGAGGFDLSQIMRMLQSEGPVNWEVASQVASWVATTDPDTGRPPSGPEAPAVPGAGRLPGLVRAAQTALSAETGLGPAAGLSAVTLDRVAWTRATLDGLRPVLEALAGAFTAPLDRPAPGEHGPPTGGLPGEGFGAEAPPGADPFAGLMAAMAPILLGVQAGSMIGFLAHHALGRYDLTLPLSDEPTLAFVAENVAAFAADWSLPYDDVCYALGLREVVHVSQRSHAWVRDHLVDLSTRYVSAYELDPEALEERLSQLDLSDPASLQNLGIEPDELLGLMASPRQGPLLEELQRFVSVLEGYADLMVERVGGRMIGDFHRVGEALRRHRVERGRAAGYVDALLGLALGREHYERGRRFCDGVVERAGLDELERLWRDVTMAPTAAELDAPGLWLARIDLAGT